MAVCNSNLIDPEQGVFSVLGLVAFRLSGLGGHYFWQCEDIDGEMAKGAAFHAWAPEDAKEGGLAIASITVVDASNDPTEPDVSVLEQDDVPRVDGILQKDLGALLVANGMELIFWMSSQLNQSDGFKGLVTVYIASDQGKQRQSIALRIKAKNRKIVVIGDFDIEKKEILAAPIFNVMRNMVLLD
jgi:hypothetical protein